MHISEIGFRVDQDEQPDWPNLTILIDGEDVIGRATRFKGFDPGAILGKNHPLLPIHPARRVAVYRCSCGIGGCGCAACVISEHDDIIRWNDFRDFVGVYEDPTTEEHPAGGQRLPVPNLVFDARQYRSAVTAASADRSWETMGRRRARMLRDRLEAHLPEIERRGYRLGRVAPNWQDPNVCEVELRIPNGQLVVAVPHNPSLDDESAVQQAAAAFVEAREDNWQISHRNIWAETP